MSQFGPITSAPRSRSLDRGFVVTGTEKAERSTSDVQQPRFDEAARPKDRSLEGHPLMSLGWELGSSKLIGVEDVEAT